MTDEEIYKILIKQKEINEALHEELSQIKHMLKLNDQKIELLEKLIEQLVT